ncbi:hypothetical protein CEXT_485201 [Caerostris extrusa]|uniref:Uncharacterized protein n=1 Tax=Caerostris extrusa TaxID=172846 RepID=A0AAV4NVI0_CAEEX|nr:hypothetical protein CEXT_485201 [Caerostris extrusa]
MEPSPKIPISVLFVTRSLHFTSEAGPEAGTAAGGVLKKQCRKQSPTSPCSPPPVFNPAESKIPIAVLVATCSLHFTSKQAPGRNAIGGV